jgi:hypothetical protein
MSMSQLYAPRCTAFPRGDHRVVILPPQGAPPIELESETARVFSMIHGCKSIDGHIEAIRAVYPQVHEPAIRAVLDSFVAFGLLRPYLRATAQPGIPDSDRAPQIPNVGIVTADRPQMLRRCLSALERHCRLHGENPRVIVVDGSRAQQNRVANEDAVARLARHEGRSTLYIGPSEASRIRARLSSMGVSRATLDFGLTPGGVGSNRNVLLVATAGHSVLMLDDDVVFEPYTLGSRTHGVTLDHLDIRHMGYFPDRRTAIGALIPAETNLLKAHGAILGRRLSTLLTSECDVDLDRACPELMQAASEPASFHIVASFPGVVGDSGMSCPDPLLFGTGRVRAALSSNKALYETAMSFREVYRIAPQTIVTHETSFMSLCMGLSNRTELAPFIPMGRNEDAVFGELMALLEPTALSAHLPDAVLHDSDRPARYERPMGSATVTGIADVVLSLFGMCRAANIASAKEARTQRVASLLRDVGKLPPRNYVELLNKSLLEQRLQDLRRAETAGGLPPFWTESLRKYRETVFDALADPRFFIPLEFADTAEPEAAVRRTQAFLVEFANLLECWSDVWSAVRRHGAPWND